MAFPPVLPPATRTDSTIAAGNHAGDHNLLAAGLADTVAEVQNKLDTDSLGAALAADRTLETRFLKAHSTPIYGALGNSILINGTLNYYAGVPSAIGAATCGNLSYVGWALPRTRGKFAFGGFYGHVGYTSTQLLAYLTDVVASGWDYCELMVVTNDWAAGIPIATTKANVVTMVDTLLAAGITPVIPTAPPISTVAGDYTGAGLLWITSINAWLKSYAGRRNLLLVDYHTALVKGSDQAWTAAYSGDGLHPNNVGAKVMGDVLAAALNSLPHQPRNELEGAYNTTLLLPDAVVTSAAADKWVGSGSTSGGFAYRLVAGDGWRGNQAVLTRGSGGDYGLNGPTTLASWIAGHRVRLAFNIDVSNVPTSGTWSAYLYNFTQLQPIAGFSAMTDTMTVRSVTVTDGVTTSGSPVVTSASAKFRPEHVGLPISATSFITQAIPSGAKVIGVSADGTTATMSVNATATQASSVITVHGPPCVAVFEFTVQADMVGDTIAFATAIGGAAGVTLGISQVTLTDLTQLAALTP